MSYKEIKSLPESAKAKSIYILKAKDKGFLNLEITVYKTSNTSYLRILVNETMYHFYKFDIYGYSENRLIELLQEIYGINIPKRDLPFQQHFSDVVKYCFSSIIRTIQDEKHYPEQNYIKEYIDF